MLADSGVVLKCCRKDDRGVLLFFTWLWDQGRRDVLVSGDWHGNTLLHKV
jgi:hypothetical protein